MIQKNVTLRLPKLYPKQYEAIYCPARYVIIEASTKVGKTAGNLIWIVSIAWEQGKTGRNYWWVAPIYSQAKIAYSRLKNMLAKTDPTKTIWKCNESELWVELSSGGRIWFKGADDPDSLYGEDVHAAVIDEATRCKTEAWHAVRSTLTATNGPVRIIGNVKGRKNWAYDLGRKARDGAPNMAYFKLTAWDAVDGGILKKEEVEDAKRMLPDAIFRELYLAEPSDDGGNPFSIKSIERCTLPYLSEGPAVCYGIDLAKSSDYSVICGLDSEMRVCTLERWQSDWGTTRRKIIDIIGDTAALIDSTGVGDPIVEDIQRELPQVEGFKFSSQSKQQIMEGLAASIQREELHFPDGWLREELESFEYEYTRTGVRYSAPAGLHDDGVCALALAVKRHASCDGDFDFRIIGCDRHIMERKIEFDGNEDNSWHKL